MQDDARRTGGLAERHESSLLSLFELSHELGVLLDPYEIAQLTLYNLMGHFGTSKAVLWMVPEAGERDAVPLRAYGLRDEAVRALGAGLSSQVAEAFTKSRAPIRLEEWAGTDTALAELAAECGLAIVAPVAAHGRMIGLVALGRRLSGDPFLPLDLEHLDAAAGMVGVALENTRIYNRMLEANRRLRQANEHLEEADELRSEFIRNINHELRTPVAIVYGYLTTVVDTWQLPESQRKTIDTLVHQCNKLRGIMQNLLDYSAFSRNAVALNLTDGDIGPMIRRYADARRPGVLQGLRELTVEIYPDIPHVRLDDRRLAQILDALVDNAVKFTPPGTRIVLRAVSDERGVRIEVEDNGPGIPSERMGLVLEPFRQVDGSPTREVGGLGLGLAVARQIAEQMSARLEVSSEVGVGTTFRIVFDTSATPS
jgi:signal transduction histidine kinase